MDVAGPIQDSWDDITEKITTSFLGYKTECVSCHNGREHLEKINLHLSRRTRSDFWRMSAFLSRMYYVRFSDDPIGFRPRIILVRSRLRHLLGLGAGHQSRQPAGARLAPWSTPAFSPPARSRNPATGARNWRGWSPPTASSPAPRPIILWSYFFGHGIVDPPDAWDLDRVDPGRPPAGDWPMQNSHPELLEAARRFADPERLSPEAARSARS